MAQHDYVISNGTGAAVRSDLNNALAAIVSNNSGSTEPATTYAYMPWADTTTGLYKIRNSANNAWITLYQLDGEWSTLPVENGTAAAPSIYFKDSGTDTGFYSPGTDQVAISTGGTGRLFINSSGSVGVGTSSPSALCHLNSASASAVYLRVENTGGYALFGVDGSGNSYAGAESNDAFGLVTNGSYRMYITAAGNVGVGTTSPLTNLHVAGNILIPEANYVYGNATSGNRSYIQMYGSASGEMTIATTFSNSFIRFLTADTERCRLDSSGRLLVGTSTGTSTAKALIEGNTSDGLAGTFDIQYGGTSPADGTNIGAIRFKDRTTDAFYAAIFCNADAGTGAADKPGRLVLSTTADGASSPTERIRIDNAGNVGINVTNPSAGASATSGVAFRPGNNDVWFNHANGVGSGTVYTYFSYNSGAIGSISQSGTTAVSYNTTSDYRLKENVIAVDDGIIRLQQLKPCKFNFISDPDRRVDGFIAHEVQSVVPEAIHGEKDAVDADGKPVYQGIDQSKLVPLLTAALQEAIGEIESLKARVAALEGA